MSQAPATQNAPASDELQSDVEIDLDAVFQALGGGDVSARAVLDALRSGQGLSAALNADGKLEKVLYQFAMAAFEAHEKRESVSR
ncbi:hypothetical protein ACJJIF_21870 (plasmid) [Microbulbifer sp. SSSA002]|uniref:hypothetical protein n=1 Tax=Microbulbifer sp. SSSA002 TaxID=3243376 RepID=UPI00403A3510